MSQPQSTPLHAELGFAQSLAEAARPIALASFRRPIAVEQKADASPVTLADRAIEAELRRMIGERYPTHGIFGEEFSPVAGDEFTWVLDPIDGTRSFISGSPLFGTLIALLQGSRPVLGIIDVPATGERWLGQAGVGTQFNSSLARCSACLRLEDAKLYTTSPDSFSGRALMRSADAWPCAALAATATATACSHRVIATWSWRPVCSPTTTWPWCR